MDSAKGNFLDKPRLGNLTNEIWRSAERLRGKFLHEHAAVESVVVEHPEYVEDSEYIPFEEDIETFLKREITTPLIRWAELPQLGYEILLNKYFYKCVPPVSTKELMKSFRLLGRQNNDG